MTQIQIPDEQAAALEAKGAAAGLTTGEPRRRKGRYELADLVAQCELKAPCSGEDKAWLEAPSAGREA